MPRPHFLGPLLRESPMAFEFRNGRNGRLVARHLTTAFDSRSRRQGLLGRDGLPQSAALVIGPCNAVHTCFMRFPIDVIFVNRAGAVVKVAHALKPWRVQVSPRAFVTVELPAGTARRADVRAGDRLTLVPSGRAAEASSQPIAARLLAAEPSRRIVEGTGPQGHVAVSAAGRRRAPRPLENGSTATHDVSPDTPGLNKEECREEPDQEPVA